MKKCAYCGRENEDFEPHCAECGTTEFVAASAGSATPNREERIIPEAESLVRDRPKFVIVAGIWLIYGMGLVGNIFLLIAVLLGMISGIVGFISFWLSIGCGTLCAYLLWRVRKNYTIHKQRALDESVDSQA